jgi:SAM-dependent methyltransferase
MTTVAEWAEQTGQSWAREWTRTDRSFSELTEILIARILAKGAAHSILDIGCGAGELSLRLSDAKPGARVLGVDVSPELIAVAKSRATDSERLSFACADAAIWRDPMFYPDLLVSRHGVMFFDQPVAAFANLAEGASAGARLVFSCFRDRSENTWAAELAALLPAMPPPEPHAPGPFGFADPEHVHRVLSAAGWTQVRAEPVDFTYVAGAGADPVGDALTFFQSIGPAARVIGALDGDEKTAVLAKLRDLAEARCQNGEVRFPAAAWIVTATRAT